MNKLIEYFVSKSVLVNLITLLIVVVGTISMIQLNKEMFPNVDFERIMIRTAYPGSTAEDVETLVSIPIERKIKEVSGVEDLNIMSGSGYSLGVVSIDPAYDVDEILQEIRNGIDQIADFPGDVESPSIQKIESKNQPMMKVALTGLEERELKKQAKYLRDKIEAIDGVSRVSISGARDYVYFIEADPDKLQDYDLSLAELSAAIQDRNINLSAGKIKTNNKNLMVRTFNDFKSIDDIKEIVIRSNTSGKSLKVSQVADVILAFKDETISERVRGEDAITLDLVAKQKSDLLKTTQITKDLIEVEVANLQKVGVPLKFEIVDEQAFYVKRRLSILAENGILGIFLVFICMLFFLNFRVSFLASMGAPLAFMVSFIVMQYFGISLNLMSMFGLILVLGMLVDDSIIVAENFYQKLEAGFEPREAAIIAAKETLAPVTATILTTIVAFGSLMLLGGIWGKFLWSVPAVVLICLIASWLECFFILPSHLADFVKVKKGGVEKNRWYQPLLNVYQKIISSALNIKYLTVLFFVALFAGAMALFIFDVEKELFPDDDVRLVFYKVKGEVGTSFESTANAIAKAEKVLLDTIPKHELESMRSMIGSQFSEEGTNRTGDQYGMIFVYLVTEDLRERSLDQIIQSMKKATDGLLPNFITTIERVETGKPKKPAIDVVISGDDLDLLVKSADEVLEIINGLEGVVSTNKDYEVGNKQLLININENEARRLGVTNTSLAIELRRALEGIKLTEIRRSDEDIEVVVRLNQKSRTDKEILSKLYVPNQMGRRIKLSRIAEIKEVEAPYVIRRKNKKRVISVYGDIDSSKTTAIKVNGIIGQKLKKLWSDKKIEGVAYNLEGEFKETKETYFRMAKSAVISLSLIYIILVGMFGSLIQPFIIMSSIPFGLIGVVGVFWLLDLPLGFMAIMGVIGLIGVVVNDSIVLVNYINIKIRDQGKKLKNAVVEACLSRFRPVILTTFTTVAGLLPIAHMPGGDPFLKPMALAFAYGLIFSTTLTLIFVPCSYFIYAGFAFKDKK